jgi:protein O-mannosyl-transferase
MAGGRTNPHRPNYCSSKKKCQVFLREKQTLSAPQNRLQRNAMSRPRLIALLLALATLLVYLPVTRSGFLQYDDDDYITNNPAVQNGLTLAGLQWAFTTVHASNWHPLTWLSHMTDCELFGLNPAAHHFVNVLFHAANAVLLFALLLRLTGALWPAAFVAALFAWHPLHVESVAWIAERKDVLSTFFALLALLSYSKFVKAHCRRSFWFTLIFFALGLMAKPMLVTLPFVMLLLDYWPLQRFHDLQVPAARRLVLEKWPFFLLAILSCIVTFLAQRGTAVASLELVPLSFRLENVPVAYAGYLAKIFWPADLAVIYPMPVNFQLPPFAVAVAAAVLIVISSAVWMARSRSSYLLVGWLWFLGTLVPVIGLVQVGAQALADRYTYLPAIGLFIMVAFGAQDLVSKFRLPKMLVAAIATLILAACLLVTENQLRYWHDSESLFRHALAVTKNNYIAHINLGVALELEGKLDEAITENRAAEAIAPNRYQIHNNLGNSFDHQGKPVEALAEYREAVRLNPRLPELHNSLGITLNELGRYDEALVEFTNAAQLNAAYPWAHFEMAMALLKQGRNTEAAAELHEALMRDPEDLHILTVSAHVLASIPDPQVRDGKTALTLATKANELTEGSQVTVLNALGMAQAENGDFTNAIVVTQKALDLANSSPSEKIQPLQNQLRRELELYRNNQPWRESFLATNAPVKN